MKRISLRRQFRRAFTLKSRNNESTSNILSKDEIIQHIPNRPKIITDDPTEIGALDFPRYAESISELIVHSKPRFTVGIFGGWGTGKTTLMSMIKNNLDTNKNIVTVWFDAWRYERENDLAVIPFLRTLKLRLDESEKASKGKWSLVTEGVIRTAGAYISSTKLTYGIKDVFSFETDFGKAADSLKGRGNIGDDRNIIYYHATDFLLKALETLRKNDKSYRIVVFVDDLDRCSPVKALEVLESIKSLFDIEGIVYVIGMNHNSINSLISKKYGEDSKSDITGYNYIKKIVQLPFLIPDWSSSDIDSFINSSVLKQLEGSPYADEFEKHKDIVTRGVEFNPREVKRFINNVILAKAVFDKPIDRLIVVQAFRFRIEWHKLFEVLINKKVDFINAYEKLQKEEESDDLIDIFPDVKKQYPDLFDPTSQLRQFLEESLHILKEIDDIQAYRRALGTVTIDTPLTIDIPDFIHRLMSDLFYIKTEHKGRLSDSELEIITELELQLGPLKAVKFGPDNPAYQRHVCLFLGSILRDYKTQSVSNQSLKNWFNRFESLVNLSLSTLE